MKEYYAERNEPGGESEFEDLMKYHIEPSYNFEKKVKEIDICGGILNLKRKAAKEAVRDLEMLIKERKMLGNELVKELEYQICYVGTLISNRFGYQMGPGREKLEKELQNLELAKINEKSICFKDILQLRRDLVKSRREYAGMINLEDVL